MNSVCVYCGSSPGRKTYESSAKSLARALVDRKLRLVYGGASVGIMGQLANGVLELGGHVTGVIPESLVKKEVAHDSLTELHVTQSMHERKALMAELSDGFVALPGGIGTLEEIFEIWTWAQLGFHGKPCGLLNANQYYDFLVMFLDHAASEQFIKPVYRSMFVVEETPDAILDRFEKYVAPEVTKWVEKEET